ncbi:hypothetical protein [Actinophytocola sp.]|uniref:hypothetical protein n=1 Tax=Actinophytocola sp. TaxID=1872138 RepID=UPI002D80A461|nr:hypothetical protein [Actinophytocola sp.]HET9142691.1 hypothetical protein [Actinophytocola sp.]
MEDTSEFPSGYRAMYRGKRYNANGGRQGQVTLWDEDTGHQVARVPIDELDEWYFFSAQGTYLGEPFRVNREIDGTLYWISYEGSNGRKIAEEWRVRTESDPGSTFWRDDRFCFDARVPKEQVHDIHEVRQDALGPWRERQEGAR